MFANQEEFDIRCEWGANGLDQLHPSDVTIIVDILSFSTCVEIALSNQAVILPFPWDSNNPEEYAKKNSALLASKRGTDEFSLSPVSMSTIPEGTRLVLPSPNGSQLTFHSKSDQVIVGCLRNAKAVAKQAMRIGKTVNVIPAGEKWNEDGTLRVAIEDMIGAGAIIHFLNGNKSSESQIANTAFEYAQSDLQNNLLKCSSGKELISRGFEEDVRLASQLNVSETVPIFRNPEFVDGTTV